MVEPIVPLMPSARWFAEFLKRLSTGSSEREAIQGANVGIEKAREFGRFTIQDSKGEMVMSVAVEGGGRQLRSYDKLAELRLSDHGDWRRVHLRAMEAAWGRKPFFRHIEGAVKAVYEDKSLSTLAAFNSAIFKTVYSFVMQNMNPASLAQFYEKDTFRQRGEEIAAKINQDLSVVQAYADHGSETVIGLLSMPNNLTT